MRQSDLCSRVRPWRRRGHSSTLAVMEAFLATFLKSIGEAAGIGVPWVGMFVVAVLISRAAIRKALDQASKVEIESLKGEIQRDIQLELEGKRAEYARDLERERQKYLREIEQERARLTLDSEVRRQIAEKVVTASLETMAKGQAILDAINGDDHQKVFPLIGQYLKYVYSVRHLLPAPTVDLFLSAGSELASVEGRLKSQVARQQLDDAWQTSLEAAKIIDRLVDDVRSELRITDARAIADEEPK